MALYRICLLAKDGSPLEERLEAFEHDDAAIEFADGIGHPHVIHIWQGERHVGCFAPRVRGWLDKP